MNEEFAIDPEACESGFEFKALLMHFGPFTGRYAVLYPKNWITMTLHRVEALPDGLGKAAAKRAIKQAIDEGAFTKPRGRDWIPEHDWPVNVRRVQAGPDRFDDVIARRTLGHEFPVLETFDPPASVELTVRPRAADLAAPARQLIVAATEVAIVDPYFRPCRAENAVVLTELLRIAAASSTCRSLVIWARADKQKEDSDGEIRSALRRTASDAAFSGRSLGIKLLRDGVLESDRGPQTFHLRYLVTERGGLRYDKGFQQETTGGVELSIVGRDRLRTLRALYLDGEAQAVVDREVMA